MNTHFLSISELQKNYPSYTPRSLEKPEKGHINERDKEYYIKAGKVDINHDHTVWKVERVFIALGLTFCAFTLIPLGFKPFCKLLSKLWKEVISGQERISLYVSKNGLISTFENSSEDTHKTSHPETGPLPLTKESSFQTTVNESIPPSSPQESITQSHATDDVPGSTSPPPTMKSSVKT